MSSCQRNYFVVLPLLAAQIFSVDLLIEVIDKTPAVQTLRLEQCIRKAAGGRWAIRAAARVGVFLPTQRRASSKASCTHRKAPRKAS